MPSYRFTVILNDQILGGSETLYVTSGSESGTAQLIQAYIDARNNILYPSMSIIGVRISIYQQKRSSVLIQPPGGPIPGGVLPLKIPAQGGVNVLGDATLTDAIWRDALQFRIQYNGSYYAQRYLAGIPAAVIGSQRSTYAGGNYSGWDTAMRKYLALVGGGNYQVLALSRTGPNAPQSIQAVVQQQAAPGYIGVQVASFTGAAFAQGGRVLVQGMRPPKGMRAATINGQWTVDSVVTTSNPNTTTVYLRGSSAIDPAQQRITPYSTVSLWGKQLYAIQSAVPVAVVPHKRGGPSIRVRGRRLSRPSLDP